jgi:hypothetical protein
MYTDPIREPDGSILAPRRVTGENGVIGDTMERLTPDHPDYDQWDRYLRDKQTGTR